MSHEKLVPGKPHSSWFPGKRILILAALLYAAGAVPSAWNVVAHSGASTRAIEQILKLHNLQNEASQSLDHFTRHHPILGTLFSGPVKGALNLPSSEQSSQALHSEVPHLLQVVRREATAAAWWSCLLVSLSALYGVTVIVRERSFTARAVLFALTCIGLVSFAVGVLAPAMIIWTAPTVPIESDNLKFVLQHEVRGIAAIIRQLFGAGHWIIGGFLFLFSIVTPLTKASLTLFITASRSRPLNFKIGQLLHTIGKWSMADVFVAGVLLALYALKFQQATRSMPCIGLSYFIGYCLLSMTTTELLVHSEATNASAPAHAKAGRKLGRGAVAGLIAAFLCVVLGSCAYTYSQYPLSPREAGAASSMPQKLKTDLAPPPGK